MPSSDKGFVQAFDGQATVDVGTMLIVESHISQAPNDKQEITPPLASLNELPEELGKIDTILADAGYYIDDNSASCEESGMEPYIPPNRDKHNQPLAARFIDPPPLTEDAAPIDKMRQKLTTLEGRKVYAQRKSTVEPVFGILKHDLGFRQFFLRIKVSLRRMDTCVRSMEYEADVYPEGLKYAKERVNLSRFQLRLAAVGSK